MPEYTLNRNYVLRTRSGVISFKNGAPTYLPPHMELEARLIGAEPVSGEGPSLLEPEKEAARELTPEERHKAMIAAFELLVEKNAREDFTAAGRPAVKAVETLTGFDVDSREVDGAWTAWRAQQASG